MLAEHGFNPLPDRREFYFNPDQIDQQENRLARFDEQSDTDPEGIRVRLKGEEVDILEQTLRFAIENGLITLPAKLRNKSWFEILHDHSINQELKDRYRYLHDIPAMVRKFRSPERTNQFNLPPDYTQASFKDFKILCEGHSDAIALLTGFGPNPEKGLYLYGNPGTGKTHLMAAFARGVRAEIIAGSFKRIEDFALGTMTEYENTWVNKYKMTSPSDVYNLSVEQKEVVDERMKGPEGQELRQVLPRQFSLALVGFPFYTTDISYGYFNNLFEDRKVMDIRNFLERRIVLIDDIHPENEKDKIKFAQDLIQTRYFRAQSGATFFSSNLSMEMVLQGEVDELARRGYSRLEQMCYPILFDADDYRSKISVEANNKIKEYLESIKSKNVNGVPGQMSEQSV